MREFRRKPDFFRDEQGDKTTCDSAFQGPDREITKGHRAIVPYARQREPDQCLRGDSDNQQYQIAGQWVIANIAGHIARHPISLVPDYLAIIGIESDMEAGQSQSTAVLLHEPRSGVVKRIDDEPAILQESPCRAIVKLFRTASISTPVARKG